MAGGHVETLSADDLRRIRRALIRELLARHGRDPAEAVHLAALHQRLDRDALTVTLRWREAGEEERGHEPG